MEGAQPTSLTLLQRVRANDQEAWRRLVHLYAPLVRYWASRGGVPLSDGDDLVQEVFKAAAGSLEHFRRDRPGDTFRGWLRGITRHLIAGHFRRRAEQAQAAGGTGALDQLHEVAAPEAPEEDDPPQQLSDLYRRAVELVRGEFEERSWRMFWQTAVEGRSPVDVAADLGVSPAAVRKAKSRVLHRLKQEVGDVLE